MKTKSFKSISYNERDYYRIRNEEVIYYECKFDNYNEAKSWIVAGNIDKIMKDLKEKNYKKWAIENVVNGNVDLVEGVTPFEYDKESGIFLFHEKAPKKKIHPTNQEWD